MARLPRLSGEEKLKALIDYLEEHPKAVEMWNGVEDYRKTHDGNCPPVSEDREHITDGTPCWCNPEIIHVEGK